MATVAAAALGPEAGPSAAGEEQCATYRKFSQGLSKDQTHELTPWVAYVYKLDEIYWSDSALVDDEDHTSTGGTAKEFQQAVRHGRVSAAAQVWLEGMPAWQTLGECCALWLVAIAWNQPPRRAPGAMRKRFSTNVKVVIAVDRIAHATMTAEMASGSPMARMLRAKAPDARPDVDQILAPEATAGSHIQEEYTRSIMAANGSVTDPLSNTSLDISEQCVNISMSKHDGRQSGASAIVEKRYCKNCRAEFAGPKCPMGHAEFACASHGAVQMTSFHIRPA